ncbi:hypothetical protein [Parvularcula maris]|nr:hypothetical protein [Parvularcula maris]
MKGPGLLRLIAVVLALVLSAVLLAPGVLGVSGELPSWLLLTPIFLLLVASVLASRARSANIKGDGEDETQDRDRP